VTLYHQYSSLLTSIGAIRYQDVAAELKKAEVEKDMSMDGKALLLQELHSLSSYSQQSADRESRDSILKKIKLFIEQNYVAQQNNLVQLKDYEGLKNFRELIFDLKAAVEVISMDGSLEQYSGTVVMTVSIFTHNINVV
jgi:hypothetical protein